MGMFDAQIALLDASAVREAKKLWWIAPPSLAYLVCSVFYRIGPPFLLGWLILTAVMFAAVYIKDKLEHTEDSPNWITHTELEVEDAPGYISTRGDGAFVHCRRGRGFAENLLRLGSRHCPSDGFCACGVSHSAACHSHYPGCPTLAG